MICIPCNFGPENGPVANQEVNGFLSFSFQREYSLTLAFIQTRRNILRKKLNRGINGFVLARQRGRLRNRCTSKSVVLPQWTLTLRVTGLVCRASKKFLTLQLRRRARKGDFCSGTINCLKSASRNS